MIPILNLKNYKILIIKDLTSQYATSPRLPIEKKGGRAIERFGLARIQFDEAAGGNLPKNLVNRLPILPENAP